MANEEIVGSVTLTSTQIWFLKCCVEAKDAVLPLHPATLDADIFAEDYGLTKDEVNEAIAELKTQLDRYVPEG